MISLPLRYFGSIDYYVGMTAHADAVILADGLFDKRQKDTHRCLIADGRGGSRSLTMPIAKPHGIARARWTDVAISLHGHWWTAHRETLATSYGRTPFYEFYIDRFLPFFSADVADRFPSLAHLCLAADAEIRRILLIPTRLHLPSSLAAEHENLPLEALPVLQANSAAPPRQLSAEGRQGAELLPELPAVNSSIPPRTLGESLPPYYQPWAPPFVPNLSALDLIFNLGPEAALYVRTLSANKLISKN